MLIQAALNGSTSRTLHTGVPLTSSELAASARAAKDAGATLIHIHPRDTSGAQTLAAEYVIPAVSAVRDATGLPVGVTSGIWTVNGEPGRRLELVKDWAGPDRPDFMSINLNEPGIEPLADLVSSLGIGIEADVWTADDARHLGECSFRDRVLRVIVEPVDRKPADAVATACEVSAELDRLGITVPQVHHGYGMATWDVLKAAAERGFDLRVGLEDTTFLPDGTPAPANAALVAAVVSLFS